MNSALYKYVLLLLVCMLLEWRILNLSFTPDLVHSLHCLYNRYNEEKLTFSRFIQC